MGKLYFVPLFLLALISACDGGGNNDPLSKSDAMVNLTASKNAWDSIRQQREQQFDKYLDQQQIAYRWFADFPLGINDGVPYIILKLLPELAPELWGSKENFLDVIGLFLDERTPDYPIAKGFGWSGLAREEPNGAVDYASFTCGACHIGRVRTDQGMTYIDGGVNAHFNLPQYRVRAYKTMAKIVGDEDSQEEKIKRVTKAIVAALDQIHANDKNYFYQNYRMGSKVFDAEYEADQVKLFKQDASSIVAKFMERTELEYLSFAALLEKNYNGFETEMLNGFGGMADATGVSTSFSYIVKRDIEKDPSADPKIDLPPTQGMTDFMVVWEQRKRKVSWSADNKQLVNGGGQWNGNIPISIFRNLAAELTMGFGKETDVRVAAFAQQFLEDLPAPAYPFAVDMRKAEKGKELYLQHCSGCHRPHNGTVYDTLGTDKGRARVASQSITAGGREGFTTICSPERTIDMPSGKVKPCAEFEGVSLAGKKEFAMMDPALHDGYNALPLSGVWAQAPYLHNGSVPTIYHLLVPNERPDIFMKSRLDYDQKLVGFSWQITSKNEGSKEEGYKYDTKAIKAFSNAGHDNDITIDDVTYKLNWSNDKESAMAIIEYMKTL